MASRLGALNAGGTKLRPISMAGTQSPTRRPCDAVQFQLQAQLRPHTRAVRGLVVPCLIEARGRVALDSAFGLGPTERRTIVVRTSPLRATLDPQRSLMDGPQQSIRTAELGGAGSLHDRAGCRVGRRERLCSIDWFDGSFERALVTTGCLPEKESRSPSQATTKQLVEITQFGEYSKHWGQALRRALEPNRDFDKMTMFNVRRGPQKELFVLVVVAVNLRVISNPKQERVEPSLGWGS
ncbi:hypothetical protein B0H63DRAFT_287030 [Podospora didyma]|uniref:Uncharacterized protein n=1 Tax=Podospora didyma TaxID=330526 RepID=A0AAE0N6G8_9PEZI|nr:hypothetical protein B0H63DRAFT_287030 [Podospora didyma]